MKKNIQEQTDKEFDKVLKGTLENVSQPFQDADWNKMSDLLDLETNSFVQNKDKPGKNSWLFLPGLLLLAVSMVLVDGLFQSHTNLKDSEELLTTTISADVQMVGFPVIQKPTETFFRYPSKINSETGNQNQRVNLIPIQQSQRYGEDMILDGTGKGSEVWIESKREENFIPAIHSRMDISDGFYPGTLYNPESSLANRSLEKKELNKKSIGKLYENKSLAFIYSPDLSVGNSMNGIGLGNSAGLNFELFISGNTSINLGSIFSRKVYQTELIENQGGYYPVFNLNADCFVWDIPVGIRHYFLNRQKTRWYVNLGLSSYFMLEENYLKESRPGDPPYYQEYSFKNQNSHPFAIANLGFGVEQLISGPWSLQVEPYYKTSFIPIGAYGASFITTGIWLGIRYRW